MFAADALADHSTFWTVDYARESSMAGFEGTLG